MSVVVWVDADDCDPPHGLDLSTEHDARKVEWLVAEFLGGGFDKKKPALVAYPLNGRIQLLSGTHRHRAAKLTGTRLPVVFWLASSIEQAWGELRLWKKVMEDVPVCELEKWTREDLEKRRMAA